MLMANKQLSVGDTTTATVEFFDKAGKEVSVASVPAWTVDQAALATIAPAADGLSAVVTAVAVGTVTVTVTAEGDPTPGVDTITVTGTVTIVDEASSGTISFS